MLKKIGKLVIENCRAHKKLAVIKVKDWSGLEDYHELEAPSYMSAYHKALDFCKLNNIALIQLPGEKEIEHCLNDERFSLRKEVAN